MGVVLWSSSSDLFIGLTWFTDTGAWDETGDYWFVNVVNLDGDEHGGLVGWVSLVVVLRSHLIRARVLVRVFVNTVLWCTILYCGGGRRLPCGRAVSSYLLLLQYSTPERRDQGLRGGREKENIRESGFSTT